MKKYIIRKISFVVVCVFNLMIACQNKTADRKDDSVEKTELNEKVVVVSSSSDLEFEKFFEEFTEIVFAKKNILNFL